MNIEVLKALANETRMQIVCMLMEKNLSAGEIAERFDLAQPSVSRHLQTLKNAGVVSTTRDCTRLIYSLEKEYLGEAIREVAKVLCEEGIPD